jgi:hypothetical protein
VHIRALRQHYRRLARFEASTNLTKALREAKRRIVAGEGLPAPRPYPWLAAPGDAWVHAGRYWFAYRGTAPAVIFAVFYDQADIPGRL